MDGNRNEKRREGGIIGERQLELGALEGRRWKSHAGYIS